MAYSFQTLKVLAAFLVDESGKHYGYDIIKKTGMLSGSLYPILARLEHDGLVESQVEDADPRVIGRRQRRYYRLTNVGVRTAVEELTSAQLSLRTTRSPTVNAR